MHIKSRVLFSIITFSLLFSMNSISQSIDKHSCENVFKLAYYNGTATFDDKAYGGHGFTCVIKGDKCTLNGSHWGQA